jgi:hypothetical protein
MPTDSRRSNRRDTFCRGKLDGRDNRFAIVIRQAILGAFEERLQGGRIVHLPGGQMKMQRMSVRVAQ